VTEPPKQQQSDAPDLGQDRSPRKLGLKLALKLVSYHVALAVALVLTAWLFPGFLAQLPIGGISSLAETADVTVTQVQDPQIASDEAGGSLLRVTSEFDRLGYARQLAMVLVGVWLLMLPVSWVHKGIHGRGMHDHSLDETTLILPGVVAAIVLVVQHSLALAFSLAGIVAGVQFRRALQDTFDALFILVAIGSGIAAGVAALEIAAVLTVFFSYTTLYVYFYGDGLESDHLAKRKLDKRLRKEIAGSVQNDED
jgi:hypothetical protein